MLGLDLKGTDDWEQSLGHHLAGTEEPGRDFCSRFIEPRDRIEILLGLFYQNTSRLFQIYLSTKVLSQLWLRSVPVIRGHAVHYAKTKLLT